MKEIVLRELVRSGVGAKGLVVGSERGFAIVLQIDKTDRTLVTSRERVRLFASLDTAGAYLRSIGLDRFEVDMSKYVRGRLRKARPDRAEALRKTRTSMRQQPLVP